MEASGRVRVARELSMRVGPSPVRFDTVTFSGRLVLIGDNIEMSEVDALTLAAAIENAVNGAYLDYNSEGGIGG